MACLAVLCVPAVSIAADPSGSTAGAADRASALLARGAGYGQPQGEPRVRALQRGLRTRGQRPGPVDGLYGPLTEAAVERLQRDSGLAVDGIVGPQTRRVLNAETPRLAPGAGYGQPGGSPQVRAIQRRLRALGQRPGPVDGLYGPRAQAAIERFQRTTGQPASGVLSPATAAALARADSDQPARRASDTRSGNEPRQRGRGPASRAESSGADDPPHRADRSRPAGGSNQSRTPTRKAADDRTEGTDGAESTSPVPLAVLALALAAIGGLLAGWLKGRRRRLEASGVAGGPVRPGPMPNGGRTAATPSVGSTAPSSPEPRRRRNGAAALGYVSVRDADGQSSVKLRNQAANIDRLCEQRGWRLLEVVRDLEGENVKGLERPGLIYALERIGRGEASCLVVSNLERLSRSIVDLGRILEWLGGNDGRLVSIDVGLDTASREGQMAAETLISAGEWERRRLADRTRKGLAAARARGAAPGRLAVDDVPALKERIVTMRADGVTLQAIADRLNAENVPTLRGGTKWRPSAVQAATGYRRPRSGATASGNGGERAGNGSSGRRGRSRQPASSRKGGGTR